MHEQVTSTPRRRVRVVSVGVALAAAAAVVAGLPGPAAPAVAASVGTAKVGQVESKLYRLGYPVGKVDGHHDRYTRLGLCAWRETHHNRVGRYAITSAERRSIMAASALPRTGRSNGIYVNETCQILYKVKDGTYVRIARVSTGRPGYGTPNGTGSVWRKWAGWHESSIYSGGWMLDSIYFRRDRPGIALHGSKSDSYVKPYPASSGCVRLKQAIIRKLFDNTAKGTKVRVYGAY